MSGHPVTMRSTGERWTLGHRPALDGVRGIAVLLVFIGHMAVPGLPGLGAVGVTVFFTLSGFLITGMLLEEHERAGRISLRRFYERRLRRLLPAFLASTAAVAIVGPFVGAWWFEWRDVPGVLLYYSNWAVLGSGGLPSLGGLSGTWSLAIEEQFYVAWPLVLLVMVRAGRRSVLLLTLTGAALSLAVRAYLLRSGASLDRIYLGTDTVAVSLLGGAALVAWQGMRPSRIRGGWLALTGVVVIAVTTRLEPGMAVIATPIASSGTVLLLAGATSAHPPAALARPALVWFGQRSYGLYLWHCPLGFLLREGTGWSWPAIVAVMLPTSLLLAECSYRYIEEPFRRRRAPSAQLRDVPSEVAVDTVGGSEPTGASRLKPHGVARVDERRAMIHDLLHAP